MMHYCVSELLPTIFCSTLGPRLSVVTGKAGHLVTMGKGSSATHKLTKRSGQLRPIADFEGHVINLVAEMER